MLSKRIQEQLETEIREKANLWFYEPIKASHWNYLGEYYCQKRQNEKHAYALYCFEKAIEINCDYPYANFNLAFMHYNGWGIKQDIYKAKEYCEKALRVEPNDESATMLWLKIKYNSINHSTDAWNNLGENYYNDDKPKKYLYARFCYELALEKDVNNIDANTNLGLIYLYGLGVPKDLQKAKEYCDKALRINPDHASAITLWLEIEYDAKNHSADAWNTLGKDYRRGNNKNHIYASCCYELALKKDVNHFAANRGLVVLYFYGLGVPKDLQKSLEYCEKALRVKPNDEAAIMLWLKIKYNSINHSADAWNTLAADYHHGINGKPQNDLYARCCYQFALKKDANHFDANKNLGTIYFHGLGVSKDTQKATDYCNKALSTKPNDEPAIKLSLEIEHDSKNRSADAWNSLGAAYHRGDDGKPKNYLYARCCYELALEKDANIYANGNLALIYFYGLGVPKDPQKAKDYCEKAFRVKPEDDTAIMLWLKIEHGSITQSANAWNTLGVNYHNGNNGKTQNHLFARGCYKLVLEINTKVIEKNNTDHFKESLIANYNLSNIYYKGLGIEINLEMASKYGDDALSSLNNTNYYYAYKSFCYGRIHHTLYRIALLQNNQEGINKHTDKAIEYYTEAHIKHLDLSKQEIKEAEQRLIELKYKKKKLDLQDKDGNTLLQRTVKNKYNINSRGYKNIARLRFFGANEGDNSTQYFPFIDFAGSRVEQKKVDQLYLQLNDQWQNLKETPVSNIILNAVTYVNGDISNINSQLTDTLNNLYVNPDIKPLLELAKFAAMGCHRLSKRKDKDGHFKFNFIHKNDYRYDSDDEDIEPSFEKFRIAIDAKRNHVGGICLWGKTGLDSEKFGGVYFQGSSKISIGGARQTWDQMIGTFIHELTHFITYEIFDNDCKPYFANDIKAQNEFTIIADDLNKLFVSHPDQVPYPINVAFSWDDYAKNGQIHGELIVRIAQSLAAYPKILCPALSPLLNYYRNNFLPAVNHHINELSNIIFKDFPEEMFMEIRKSKTNGSHSQPAHSTLPSKKQSGEVKVCAPADKSYYTKQSAFFAQANTTNDKIPADLQKILQKSARLNNCVTKGYVSISNLIDLHKNKPWVIAALRCSNIYKGICNRNIDVDQLSKLTQEQVISIRHKLNDGSLQSKVEGYLNQNKTSSIRISTI